jgi:hypothetical protein
MIDPGEGRRSIVPLMALAVFVFNAVSKAAGTSLAVTGVLAPILRGNFAISESVISRALLSPRAGNMWTRKYMS